jgi:hypothetical protein
MLIDGSLVRIADVWLIIDQLAARCNAVNFRSEPIQDLAAYARIAAFGPVLSSGKAQGNVRSDPESGLYR